MKRAMAKEAEATREKEQDKLKPLLKKKQANRL